MSSARPILASKRVRANSLITNFLRIVKKDIHPEYNPVCFVDVSSGKRFFGRSTLRSKQTETIDGVEHQVFLCDITSDSHPAYTGEKRFVDTAGRVEKFRSKFSRSRK
ncbi:MAG: hypothetical protein Tsb0018_04220 [Opitutales bacterium]|tara:strand:- start:215 stop:538 length:324 start_codon:yes stop_codon:yes gene_type:complete